MRNLLAAVLVLVVGGGSAVAQTELRPNGNINLPNECPSHEAVIEAQIALLGPDYRSDLERLGCRPISDIENTLFQVVYCDGTVMKVIFLRPEAVGNFQAVRTSYVSTDSIARYVMDPMLRQDCEAKSKYWEATEWEVLARARYGAGE